MNNKIEILDSTLREGEQTPGVSFTRSQKIEIAKMLDDFGVDFIELGHPAVSEDIYSTIKLLNSESLASEKIVHARLKKSDIDDAVNLGIPWIGLFFGTSEDYLYDKYNLDEKNAIEMIKESVGYAKRNGLKIRFTAEDASRTDIDFLIKIGKIAEKAGADRFSIADTVGILYPNKVSELVSALIPRLKIPLHIHCHNDFGLATANALQALQSGVKCVDVTINGLGERCGLPPLAEVTASLDELFKIDHSWNLKKLKKMSSYIDRVTKMNNRYTRPITGKYSFSHKAGIHVNAMLKNQSSYESMSPKKLNRRHKIIIDKYTGRKAIEYRLGKLKFEYSDQLIDNIVMEIKRNPSITNWTDKEIMRLAEEFLSSESEIAKSSIL